MANFDFVAMNQQGKEVRGRVSAANAADAGNKLRAKGLFAKKVTEEGAGGGAAAKKPAKKSGGLNAEIKLPSWMQGRVKAKDVTTFTRQLSTLISAGLPLMRAMRVVERQEKNAALKNALAQMAESVEGGSTFAEALAAHPKIFDRLYVNMVKAGEAGGVMDVVLSRLAEFQEKAAKIAGKVKSAMTYPIVVLCLAVGILVFLMTVIVPKFQEIFADMMGAKGMPAITQFVINASDFVKTHWYVILGVVVGIVVVFKVIGATKGGKMFFDRVKMHIPVFGDLTVKSSVSRFTRTLGTLMGAGVPVLQALNIVRETLDNQVIANAVGTVHDAVKEGENMAPPLASTKVFPPMVISMVEVGEETGALPAMLTKIADTYDEDVDNAVGAMTSIIEPLLIIFLAVVVGTIVVALFMPMISIMGGISG